MKINTLLLTSIIAITLTVTTAAKDGTGIVNKASELASPIVSLMPIVVKMRDELGLNDDQNKTIDEWLAEAPGSKKQLQQDVLTIRSALRDAILDRASRTERDALKVQLTEANTRLIELSSLCTRMLHNTMTKEQYTKIVTQYKNANQS